MCKKAGVFQRLGSGFRGYRWQERRWECQEGPGFAGVCRLENLDKV